MEIESNFMKRIIKSSQDIFCMANLYLKRTGFPYLIWADNLGVARKNKYNLPRIKVQNVKGDKVIDDAFVISISKTPEVLAGRCKIGSDLNAVKQYIQEHYDDFMAHWNQEIDEDELKDRLYLH